ncbi:HU family DNA-binding protein [Streptomyces sp. NPDC093595]|uniref:HU family DNA-binding protein n=1 Tax=unclassified Streptomyces TaxID=2593676 RepID=UPI0037A33FD8
MDRSALAEAVTRKVAQHGSTTTVEEAGRVIDALFGTVEQSGAIADALKDGRTVTLLGFGSFHPEDGTATLRPGQALVEYLQGTVG